LGSGESVRGVQLKVRIVVAIPVFGYSVCVNLEAIFLQWLCLFANCMHEGRKEPFVFLFFYVVLGVAKCGW